MNSPWLTIGSVAARHWIPEFRNPRDIDILTPGHVQLPYDTDWAKVETQWHREGEFLISKSKDPVFADLDLLYSIKVSHAHWNVKWNKTISDIIGMKMHGAKLDLEVYDRLIPIWEEVHGKKRAYLNQSVEEFFDDNVKRIYDHEYLHELVAFNSYPMHERIRKDLSSVMCSEDLFNALSPEEQAETALEEILVTAIERKQLRQGCSSSLRALAMSDAHFLLCTSMTKGWFARYLIENKYELLYQRREKWKEKLRSVLKSLSDSSRAILELRFDTSSLTDKTQMTSVN
jgi:hypothetical protein